MKIFPRFVWPAVTVVLLAGTAAPAQAQDYDPLTLGEALTLIEATKDAGAEMNIRLSIAIVDGRGDLVTMARMEGARPTTADTAIGKAMTSAFTGRPSAATAGSGGNAFYASLNARTGGRLRFFQGALPIVRDGVTIGAVGASGASAQDDETAVRRALAAVGLD